MKTRRTRASGGTDDGVEGDPTLIGFRRYTPRGGPNRNSASSNASAASGADTSKKSTSSHARRFTRSSGGSVGEESKEKSSSAAPARRSTRTAKQNGAPANGDISSDAVAVKSKGKPAAKKAPTASYKSKGKASVTSRSRGSRSGRFDKEEKSSENVENEEISINDILAEGSKPAPKGKRHQEEEEEENDDQSLHMPPVKEITTTTSTKSNITNINKNKRGDGPKYLDDATMKLVQDYINEHNGDTLDEDEVVAFMTRMQKTANEQARHQKQLITGVTSRHHPDSDQSDCGSDDTSVFIDCLEEEEEHAVGHDLFKKIVASIQLEHARKNGGVTSKGSLTKSANKLLDKKTLMWIKRAAGLHRTDPGKMLLQKHADGKGGRMSTRRYTRKQALDRRADKQKKDRGLDILGAAVDQLETVYGPFPARKIKRKKKKSRRVREQEEEEAADRKRKKEKVLLQEENKAKRNKTKSSSQEDEEEEQVLVVDEEVRLFAGAMCALMIQCCLLFDITHQYSILFL